MRNALVQNILIKKQCSAQILSNIFVSNYCNRITPMKSLLNSVNLMRNSFSLFTFFILFKLKVGYLLFFIKTIKAYHHLTSIINFTINQAYN